MIKNIIKASLLMGVMIAVSSCKEDTYNIIDPSAIPQAGDYDIILSVDQETNQYTLNISNPVGVYPIWKIYTKANPVISTRDGYSDIITVAGDYEVEMQVGNKNGISEGVKTATIHIDNTLVDFNPYVRNMTDGSSKMWHIAADQAGHLGCGPSGTEGLEWWSASPNDKKDWGVYENQMTFTDNGGNGTGLYTYDPGESGTIYVNTGITDLEPYSKSNTNDGQDYCAPAPLQENVPFTLSVDGVDLYLSFPEGTLMGYLPNVELYNNPKFKVNAITKNKIELTCDNGDIAWHYILAPWDDGNSTPTFNGFKYDSEFNLWKNAPITLASTWFADGGWGELNPQPSVEVSADRIFLHTPAEMGNDQWQGQVHINTGITISSGSNYDFSMWLNAPVDCQITVKPHLDGDDNTFFVADKQSFDAGGSCYWFHDLPGFDGPLVLTLDFAGYQDMDFEITNIVLKDAANDDGSEIPEQGETPEAPVSWVDVDSADNLFNGCNYTFFYYYAPGWAQIADPETLVDGNSFTLSLPEATTDQWQAQFAIKTDIATSADKNYDFRVTFYSNGDIPGVTFKCTQEGDDNLFYMADRVAVGAYDEVTYKWINQPGLDINPMNIFFDFGGNPAGTQITIKDIIIQEHRE